MLGWLRRLVRVWDTGSTVPEPSFDAEPFTEPDRGGSDEGAMRETAAGQIATDQLLNEALRQKLEQGVASHERALKRTRLWPEIQAEVWRDRVQEWRRGGQVWP